MFKYTPHPEVIRKYDSIRKNSKQPCNDQFILGCSIVGSTSGYFECGDFWKHYKGLQFYSTTQLREVPVNGVLISYKHFIETKV